MKKTKHTPDGEIDWKALRSWLGNLGRKELTDIVLERARADERLGQYLLIMASAQRTDLSVVTLKRIIDRAFGRYNRGSAPGDDDAGDGYEPEEAAEMLRELLDAIPSQIDRYLQRGRPRDAIAVSEHLLVRLDTLGDYDATFEEYYESVRKLHFRACACEEPDPDEAAEHIFHLAITKGIRISADPKDYLDLLGETGIEDYRSLVRKAWSALPPSLPEHSRNMTKSMKGRLQCAMEQIAADTGYIDVTIAIREKNIFDAQSYLDLAQLCLEHAREEKALAWAEKGWWAFCHTPCAPLRDFLIEQYLARSRYDEAMDVLWYYFSGEPGAASYAAMHALSGRIGDAGFRKRWKEKSIAVVRKEIGSMRRARKEIRLASPFADFSEIVRIHLIDCDGEAAWQAAMEGECSQELWLELAKEREKDHPEDAVAVYQALAGAAIERSTIDAYTLAVEWIGRTRALLKRLRREEEWELFLNDLWTKYRAKRNFIALLKKMERGKDGKMEKRMTNSQ